MSNMKIFYDDNQKRLVFIGHKASPSYWENLWKSDKLKQDIISFKNRRLILKVLKKYIKNKNEYILEGGCGIGGIVYCMHMHQYRPIGIDFAGDTIKKTYEIFPDLNLIIGDVRELPFPDSYFIGYWSLGVIEHFLEGYNDILSEMRRVVKDQGYVFLVFPYMSPMRIIKARLGVYEKYNNNLNESFYQYALNPSSVINDFESNGFLLIEKRPLDGITGLKYESMITISLLNTIEQHLGSTSAKAFELILNKMFAKLGGAHAILLIFKNEKINEQ